MGAEYYMAMLRYFLELEDDADRSRMAEEFRKAMVEDLLEAEQKFREAKF